MGRPSAREAAVHGEALRVLNAAGIPYVVGGAAAVHFYTGLRRATKDLDLFLLPAVARPALAALAAHGYTTWVEAPHWLGKAAAGEYWLDLIWGFPNWLAPVDDLWLRRAVPGTLLGWPVRFAPPEELIWMKAYLQHRERYDGADIAHLLRACGARLDWRHLRGRFAEHGLLLLQQLLLFVFIYPGERGIIPADLWADLLGLLARPPAGPAVCQGTLLDRFQYLADILVWGDRDVRETYARRQGVAPALVAADRVAAARLVRRGLVRPAPGGLVCADNPDAPPP